VIPVLSPGRWCWELHGRSYVIDFGEAAGPSFYASVQRIGTKARGFRWRLCIFGNHHVGEPWADPKLAILEAERVIEAAARMIAAEVLAAPTRETKGGTDA
jgi:hypothetical protein